MNAECATLSAMDVMEEEMELLELAERMEAAVAAMERAVAASGERVEKIVATVESEREAELERKLEEAEARIAALQAAAGSRKTVGVMMAKDGAEVSVGGALDGALAMLSVEQRIAVKAELLRAGVV